MDDLCIMDLYIYIYLYIYRDRQTDRQIDAEMDRWIHGQMDGWMDRQIERDRDRDRDRDIQIDDYSVHIYILYVYRNLDLYGLKWIYMDLYGFILQETQNSFWKSGTPGNYEEYIFYKILEAQFYVFGGVYIQKSSGH